MEPQRTEASPTTCCCRLTISSTHLAWDSCAKQTSGPDEPICDDCERAGHPTMDTFDPTIKNVRSMT